MVQIRVQTDNRRFPKDGQPGACHPPRRSTPAATLFLSLAS